MSIQTSLSRSFAVQTLLGLSLACAGIYAATRWSFQVKQDEEFRRHAEIVQHVTLETMEPLDLDALRHKLDDYFQSRTDVGVSLSAGPERLYTSGERAQGSPWQFRASVLPGTMIEGKPVSLRIGLLLASDQALLSRLAWTLVGAAALGTLLVSMTGSLIVRRGLRPLKRLAAETAVAGPALPGHRIEPAGYGSELRPWIRQFNALLERVEAAYTQLEAFNADVAHELRTPLSNLIAQAEIELGRDRPKDALKDILASQLEETRRLAAIVSDMQFLSRADQGEVARRGAPESIAAHVRAVAEFQETTLEDARLTLEVHGEEMLPIDAGLVRRAVSNLVSNAVRYATPYSAIRIAMERRDDLVHLRVENAGPAIPAEALARLFERFYRAEPSRSGSSSHHGLGLSIVAAIARMHGGTTFADHSNGVTRIGLTLRDTR